MLKLFHVLNKFIVFRIYVLFLRYIFIPIVALIG